MRGEERKGEMRGGNRYWREERMRAGDKNERVIVAEREREE